MTESELYDVWLSGEYFEHANRPFHIYVLSHPVKVKIDGEWKDGYAYYDVSEPSEVYVRTVDNFQNCSVI